MTAVSIDLDQYFKRIGYGATVAPTLDTLQHLVALHTRAIPFENLNPFLGLPVHLDLPSIEQKLVRAGRGGYCYEQNALLRAVLESIGFSVSGHAARVLWQQPEGAEPAQSHMMLRVLIEGTPYLADVGFGGQTPTAPLRLDIESAQQTPHGSYRVLRRAGDYLVESRVNYSWMPIYSSDLRPQSAGDYKVFNWYCSTSPDSHFTTGLVASLATEEGRYNLRDCNLAYYPNSGEKRESALRSTPELREVLTGIFGITLPETALLEPRLQALPGIAKGVKGVRG